MAAWMLTLSLEASQVHFLPLEEVIKNRSLVIAVVEVTKIERTGLSIAYDFKPLRWLSVDRLQ
jgi:hypothetical protein